MFGLIQRVSEASVVVEGQTVGAIGPGILLLLGVAHEDGEPQSEKLLHKVLNYRIFPDANGHMNLSLTDTGGGLLIVSQFTLVADTKKGLRPSFSSAAPPALAEQVYDDFVAAARKRHPIVGTGRFGADMKVTLVNDGPVTFMLTS